MSHPDVIRAWKDEKYRNGLSAAQRALLPAHPAGIVTLSDSELYAASGLAEEFSPRTTAWFCTLSFVIARCCP